MIAKPAIRRCPLFLDSCSSEETNTKGTHLKLLRILAAAAIAATAALGPIVLTGAAAHAGTSLSPGAPVSQESPNNDPWEP